MSPHGIFHPCVRWVREADTFCAMFARRVRFWRYFQKSAIWLTRNDTFRRKCVFGLSQTLNIAKFTLKMAKSTIEVAKSARDFHRMTLKVKKLSENISENSPHPTPPLSPNFIPRTVHSPYLTRLCTSRAGPMGHNGRLCTDSVTLTPTMHSLLHALSE